MYKEECDAYAALRRDYWGGIKFNAAASVSQVHWGFLEKTEENKPKDIAPKLARQANPVKNSSKLQLILLRDTTES